MSEDLNNLNKEQLVRKVQVLQYAIRLRQEISMSLVSDHETGRMHKVLRHLTDLVRGDVGYFLLFDGPDILTADFYTPLDDVRFMMGQARQEVIPEKMAFRSQPGQSLYGGLSFTSSVVLPILEGRHRLGIIEIGSFSGQMEPERVQLLMEIHKILIPTFWILKDHLVSTTVRRIMQASLVKSQKMYETVMSSSHDMIVTFDTKARIQSINAAGRTLLGLAEDEEAGSLEMESPSMQFIISQLEMGVPISDIEIALHTRDDRHLFCLVSLSAEWGLRNDIVAIHGVFKDITDRIASQRELWRTNIELSELNEQLQINQQQLIQKEKLASIGQLAAGVAHEINNPLGFVQSNHLTMKQYFDRLLAYIVKLEAQAGWGEEARKTEKVSRVIDDIPQLLVESDQGYHRIIKIVQSLKDFSRIDTLGTLSAENLNKAIDDTLTVARNNWKYVAEIRTDYQLEGTVECYLDELNQVFLNLIVNAAQAIAEQNRGSPGSIAIRTWEKAGQAFIQVEDDGPGIPDVIRNRIFDPFFTTKPIGQGTGLGLSMAYDTVVKKHHGEIKVEDSPHGGASFLIILPLLQDKGATEVSNAAE